MKLPRLRIRTLMIIVAAAAFITWGLVILPGLHHSETSILLGILLGAGSWVVPLVAVCVVSRSKPRSPWLPVEPVPHEREAKP